jgi:exodeoxyribonuclease V gamma subunit
VWFELEEATIEDSEPFELDGLQHYQLKALLLDTHLTEGESEARRHRLQLSGLLPQGWFGSLLLERSTARWASCGAAASLDGGQTGGGDRSPWPRGSSRAGWTPEGRALVVKPGSFNGKDAAGLDPAPLPLIEQRPGDTLLFDAKQSLRLPRLAADEARPRLAAWWPLDPGDEAAAALLPEHCLGGSRRSRRIRQSRRRPTRRHLPASTAATW